MLKCSTSLWSADLANLATDMKRVEPYSERFHVDVCDGHYVPQLLFFPDMVRALRPHTELPMEVHLMTTDPRQWVEPFAEAGADVIIFDLASAQDPAAVIGDIRGRGKQAGICLQIHEPLELIEPYWQDLAILTIVGTQIGIKGAMDVDPAALEKMHQARQHLDARKNLTTEIQADGAIRRHTVPRIFEAGADWIVPGSLMFKEDPDAMRQWLASL